MSARRFSVPIVVALLAACSGGEAAAPTTLDGSPASTAPITTAPAGPGTGTPPSGDPDRPVTALPGLLDDRDEAIAGDPEIRSGVLANGLTYYVRHNAQPGGHVSLRLAVRAGSADELGPTTGVAHFLEHMLFNGTEKYPHNELVDVLRGFGAAFGADVNAYTGYDETVYELSVPNDPSTVALALDVLDQWLGHATLDDDDVVAERGVVLDEWRSSTQTLDGRLFALAAEHFLDGTRYDGRAPIGTADDIQAMDAATLREFYDTWYRPDNVAVIVVGDVNVDTTVDLIETRFSASTPRSETLPGRTPAAIREFTEPGYVLHRDAAQPNVDVEVTLPLPAIDGHGTAAERAWILDYLAFDVLVRRLARDAAGGDAPFDDVVPGSNSLVTGLDAPALYAFTDIERAEATLQALLDEYERAWRHGFAAGEVDVAVAALRAQYQTMLAGAGDRRDDPRADDLVAHFVDGVPVPDDREAAERGLAELDAVTPEALAARFAARYTNTAPQVIISVPADQADEAPDAEAVLAAIAALPERELAPRTDPVELPDELMERPDPVPPVGQRPLSSAGWGLFDPVEYTYPNGVRVVLVPNDIVAGEIYLAAESPGGTAMVPAEDLPDAMFATEVVTTSGAGPHSKADLADLTAGADVELYADLQPYTEAWEGWAASADAEVLLQLLHLYTTAPRVDPVALSQTVQRYRPLVDDPGRDPDTAGAVAFGAARYGDSPHYRVVPTPEQWDTLDADGIDRVWRDRFGDASDWTFVIAGDFDRAEMLTLASAYLATLPGSGRVDAPPPVTPPPPAEPVSITVSAGTGDTASVQILYTTPAERLSAADDAVAEVAGALLSARVERVVREEFGDSYSPGVVAWIDTDPDPVTLVYAYATGSPARIEAIAGTIRAELAAVASGDFSDAEFAAAKAPVVQSYQYVDNGQFVEHLLRAAADPDYDLDGYVYETAEEVDAARVAAFLAAHVPPDAYAEAIVVPRG